MASIDLGRALSQDGNDISANDDRIREITTDFTSTVTPVSRRKRKVLDHNPSAEDILNQVTDYTRSIRPEVSSVYSGLKEQPYMLLPGGAPPIPDLGKNPSAEKILAAGVQMQFDIEAQQRMYWMQMTSGYNFNGYYPQKPSPFGMYPYYNNYSPYPNYNTGNFMQIRYYS